MIQILGYGGIVLVVLQSVSVILHVLHLNAIAALDDKAIAILQKLGVQPPSN